MDFIAAALGAVGIATALAMLSAPANHFRVIVKRRSVGEWSVLPYIVGFTQCLFWLVYDIHVVLLEHGVCNAVGMLFFLAFVLIFAYFADGRRSQVIGQLAACVGATAATCSVVLGTAQYWTFVPGREGERAGKVLGLICGVLCVSMYAAPLDVARKVILRQVAVEECLPLFYSVMIVVNLSVWTAYGMLEGDANVWFPAFLGALLGVLQLVLYARYRNLPPKNAAPAATFVVEEPRPVIEAQSETAEVRQQHASGAVDLAEAPVPSGNAAV